MVVLGIVILGMVVLGIVILGMVVLSIVILGMVVLSTVGVPSLHKLRKKAKMVANIPI
jgi:hypothetical protein